jgi:hypothetical protein
MTPSAPRLIILSANKRRKTIDVDLENFSKGFLTVLVDIDKSSCYQYFPL